MDQPYLTTTVDLFKFDNEFHHIIPLDGSLCLPYENFTLTQTNAGYSNLQLQSLTIKTHVTNLSINECQIRSAIQISHPTFLLSLELSSFYDDFNQINLDNLAQILKQTTNLQSFKLSFSHLKSLSVPGKITNLQLIQCEIDQLTIITPSFIENLTLHCIPAKADSIPPPDLSQLHNLKHLNVMHFSHITVPRTVVELQTHAIANLDLSQCRQTSVDNSVKPLEKLSLKGRNFHSLTIPTTVKIFEIVDSSVDLLNLHTNLTHLVLGGRDLTKTINMTTPAKNIQKCDRLQFLHLKNVSMRNLMVGSDNVNLLLEGVSVAIFTCKGVIYKVCRPVTSFCGMAKDFVLEEYVHVLEVNSRLEVFAKVMRLQARIDGVYSRINKKE